VVDLTSQVSDVEDIDLPKTITELTLQQTAYQAALAATARIVQPTLVDYQR
jgi:flagellar hook-associated protein 3 FlgL